MKRNSLLLATSTLVLPYYHTYLDNINNEEEAQDWEEVDGCEEEKKFIGNMFVDKFVEDDDQFKWGMIVDVLTNRSGAVDYRSSYEHAS